MKRGLLLIDRGSREREAEEELETVTESRKASVALRLNDLKVLKELIN